MAESPGIHPYAMPYPFETLRHWYITPFGGRSRELGPSQVGINSRALGQNTNLVPDEDRVLISILGQDTQRSLFSRDPFRVIALDPSRPEALGMSPEGEAVLPAEPAWEVIRRPYLQPAEGQNLLLNSVTSSLLGKDPREVLASVVAQRLHGRPRTPWQ